MSNPIVIDANRRIGNILFDTANVGPYVIGSNGGNALTLSLQTAVNSVTMSATAASSEVIAAPIAFTQTGGASLNYAFNNNSASASTTLSLTGAVNATNTTRFYGIILGGSNTGDNIISGNINYTVTTGVASGVATSIFTKTGAGKWILSGSNTFASSSTGPVYAAASGIQVNGGTLSLRNNNAFGTDATASRIQSSVNSGGTLELANGITLDNGVGVNLNTGGTISSSGTNAMNGRVNVGTAAATVVTLSTVGSADVLTIGNAANEITGGAADSVINIAGPGTVAYNFASNYAGGYSINAGTLSIGNATALGAATTAKVSFGAGSTGRLLLNGNSVTVVGLNSNATVGSPVIENVGGAAATLTVNNATASTYAGVIRDGSGGGAVSLVKGAAGTLELGGANAYTGTTTVNNGRLRVTNATGSATGTGAVAINNTGSLAGTGFITGAVTVASGGKVAPGVAGVNGGIGTLTVGSLNVTSGTLFDYDFGAGTNDLTVVTDTNGLTLNGGTFNLFNSGGATPLTTVGTYNIVQYAGTIGGTGLDSTWTTADAANPHIGNAQGGFKYQFGTSGNFITLSVLANTQADTWILNGDGNWSVPANWQNGSGPGGVGGGAGVTVHFLNAITADHTVSVDQNEIAGGIEFNNVAAKYTLGAGGGTLKLDNNGATALVSVVGTHAISAPLQLTAGGVNIAPTSIGSLTISGPIGETTAASLTMSGAGNLILTGATASTYSGGTNLNAGVTTFSNLGNLGTGGVTFDGGTLRFASGNTADLSARTVTINAGGATLDTNGNDVTFANAIGNSGAGGLTKAGAGSLVLTGLTNTFAGPFSVNGGTVLFDNLNNFGTGTAVNVSGGTLKWATGTTTDISARTVTIGANGATFDTNGNDVALAAAIGNAGTGGLTKAGAGKLTLATGNTQTGPTVLAAGTLAINGDTSLGAAPAAAATNLTIAAGSTLQFGAATTLVANRRVVLSGGTAVIDTNGNAATIAGAISGAGTLRKTGGGILTLTGANTGATGGTLVDGTGSITAASANSLPTGTITLNDTAGIRTTNNGANSFATVVVNGTNFITGTATGANIQGLGTVTGAGTLTFGAPAVNDFTGSLAAFTGTIITNGGVRFNGTTGGINLTLDLSDPTNGVGNGVTLRGGATTINIGEIKGIAGSTLGGGGGGGGAVTYSIGAKTVGGLGVTPVDSTFDGLITNGATTATPAVVLNTSLTKVGNSKLTLTHANSYSGITTINAGVLNINGQFALGGAVYGGITFTGGTLQYAPSAAGGANGSTDVSQDSTGVAKPFTLGAGGGTIDTNGIDVTYANSIGNSGAGGLTKTGLGALNLNAASTYTGATTVNAGTLNSARGLKGSGLTVAAGARANVLANGNGSNLGTSDLTTLALAGTASAPTATFDIGDNAAVIRNGVLATIYAQTKASFENGGNFDFNGPGITSSAPPPPAPRSTARPASASSPTTTSATRASRASPACSAPPTRSC